MNWLAVSILVGVALGVAATLWLFSFWIEMWLHYTGSSPIVSGLGIMSPFIIPTLVVSYLSICDMLE